MRFMPLLALLLPLAAFALPTGLNMMPTADVLGLGDARLEYRSDGGGLLFVPMDESVYGTQTGFIFGLEGGIDHSDGDTLYNLKWRFINETLVTPALAAGIQNVGGGDLQYYLVATKRFVVAGAHAGLLRDTDTDDNITMLGADAKLGPITLKADRLGGGAQDVTAIGAYLSLGAVTVHGIRYDYEFSEDDTTFGASYTYRAF